MQRTLADVPRVTQNITSPLFEDCLSPMSFLKPPRDMSDPTQLQRCSNYRHPDRPFLTHQRQSRVLFSPSDVYHVHLVAEHPMGSRWGVYSWLGTSCSYWAVPSPGQVASADQNTMWHTQQPSISERLQDILLAGFDFCLFLSSRGVVLGLPQTRESDLRSARFCFRVSAMQTPLVGRYTLADTRSQCCG